MLFAEITPIAVDDKYSELKGRLTPEEIEKSNRLTTWETPNYKAKEIGVFEE
jgi:hypothetical protein